MKRISEIMLGAIALGAMSGQSPYPGGRQYDPNSKLNVTAGCAFNPKRKKPAKPKTFQKKKVVKNSRRWEL